MCEAQLIYGFCLHKEEQYRKVLRTHDVQSVLKEQKDICQCRTECDCLAEFPYYLANYKIVERYHKSIQEVEVVPIDGENTAKSGIDGDCIVIGVCVNSGEGHHTGILEIPWFKWVAPEHMAALDTFVAKFPQFAEFERNMYVVYSKT
jgi:hypothetical protein